MPARSNCLVFALAKWFRHGGYLIVRRSRYGWFPHFLWARDLGELEVEQFVPLDPRRRLLPPLVFRGWSKRGPDA